MGKLENFLKTHETLYKSLKYTLLSCITQLQNTDKRILTLSLPMDLTRLIDTLISSNQKSFAEAIQHARSVDAEKECIQNLKSVKNNFLDGFESTVGKDIIGNARKSFDNIVKAFNRCMGKKSLVRVNDLLECEKTLNVELQRCPFPESYANNILGSKVHMMIIDAVFILSIIHYHAINEVVATSGVKRQNHSAPGKPKTKRSHTVDGTDES